MTAVCTYRPKPNVSVHTNCHLKAFLKIVVVLYLIVFCRHSTARTIVAKFKRYSKLRLNYNRLVTSHQTYWILKE